jgi:TRAP-type C4-dicarboxylate transport system permease small subunit
MKRATRIIGSFLKYGTLLSTAALILSVLVQIYARFFMENAPSWTEEASRLFFIYAICFASGLAFKQNYFVSLDLITGILSKESNKKLETVITAIVFLLFLVLAIYAVAYIKLGLVEKSPSLGFNMSISFASILLMSASICFFAGIRFLQLIKNKI